jgi:sec-independent protein translocase protein TatA
MGLLDNPVHIAFLLVVVLLVFGAKRLPEIGRSLGAGMREFKDSISGESKPALTQTSQQPQAPAQPVAAQAPATAQAPAPAPAQPVPTPAETTVQAQVPDIGL